MANDNQPTQELQGQVALITGAARGQGRSHAVRLAAAGADILAVDLCGPMQGVGYPSATATDLDETQRLVEEAGGRILARQADVRDFQEMEAAVAEGLKAFGHIDIVVANAGLCTMNRVWELTPEQWTDTINTNLTGVWHTVKCAVPPMIERAAGGSIILTASTAGTRGLPFLGHYTASKHGVIGLMRTLANELGEFFIRANAISPTSVDTAMGHDPEMERFMARFPDLSSVLRGGNALPVPRIAPGDVSDAVLWLAGPGSRYVTGAVIPVDAGFDGR